MLPQWAHVRLRTSRGGPLGDSAGFLREMAQPCRVSRHLSSVSFGVVQNSLKSRIFVIAVDIGKSGKEFRFVLCNLDIHVLCLPSLGEWAMRGSAKSC